MTMKLTSTLVREVRDLTENMFSDSGASIGMVFSMVYRITREQAGKWNDDQIDEVKTTLRNHLMKVARAGKFYGKVKIDPVVEDHTHLPWDYVDWAFNDTLDDVWVREMYPGFVDREEILKFVKNDSKRKDQIVNDMLKARKS